MIMWGDSKDDVLAWLGDRGIPYVQAISPIKTYLLERSLEVRLRGVKACKQGICYIMLFSGIIFAILYVEVTMNTRIVALLCVPIIYGGYRLSVGMAWLISGARMHGSLTDMDT
jgi:hypothetical protein